MTRLENIAQQRLEKIDRIKARGINPFPNRYHRSHTTKEAINLFIQQDSDSKISTATEFKLAGRITANRRMGKITFMDIHDSSGKIQLHFSRDLIGNDKYDLLPIYERTNAILHLALTTIDENIRIIESL